MNHNKQGGIMFKKEQKHLTLVERSQISLLKTSNFSIRNIARELRIDKSVISRELGRNSDKNGHYDPQRAQECAENRKINSASKARTITPDILENVRIKMKETWSPEQISGFIKENNLGKISSASIYDFVWRDKSQGGNLYKHLRHKGKPYMKRKGKEAGKDCIPGRIDIDQRDKIVEEKSRIGDFEADIVVGAKHKGFIVTLVDRKSKFCFFQHVNFKTKEEVTKAIITLLKPYKAHVLTITFDNGKEFSGHTDISKALDAKCYFAKPYHSHQRGLNEHTNGLLREFIPKKTDLRNFPDEKIKEIQNLINNRPRKVLNYKKPMEVFYAAVS